MRLKTRHIKILTFIQLHQDAKGYPPSCREMAVAAGLKSISTVSSHLTNLCRHKYLTSTPGVARTWKLTEKGLRAIKSQ